MSFTKLIDAEDLVEDRWDQVIAHAGGSNLLHKRRQPCPVCQAGTDRFVFYDLKTGKNWCNQCGMARSGWRVLMALKGMTYRDACDWVRAEFGAIELTRVQPALPWERASAPADPEAQRKKLQAAWQAALPVTPDTAAWRYLHKRVPNLPYVPACIRAVRGMDYWEKLSEEEAKRTKRAYRRVGTFRGMLVAIQDMDDRVVNLWRYYLTDEGEKAPVEEPKKGFGPFLHHGPFAARIGKPSDTLGVAEGLESALGAWALRGTPVWATMNAGGLEKFAVPASLPNVNRVVIYGDNDEPDQRDRRRGNEAAKKLKSSLIAAGKQVTLILPASTRFDVADANKRAAQRVSTLNS